MRFRAAVPLLLLLAAVLPGLVKTTAASSSTPTPASTANPQVIAFPPTPGGTCTTEYFEVPPPHIDTDVQCPDGRSTLGCFAFPYNTFQPCTPTPVVRPLVEPDKSVSVGPRVDAPANTSQYNVTVVSRLACFTLTEPIELFLLNNAQAAVITALTPKYVPSSGGSTQVMVDPATGVATLLLEVSNQALSNAGLVLKAVWPQEGLEILNVVVPPVTTPVPTPGPGTIGTLPTQVAAQQTPSVTPTPGITGTPTSLPIRSCIFAGLSVNGGLANISCEQDGDSDDSNPTGASSDVDSICHAVLYNPNPGPHGTPASATLYVQTLPGAVCTATVEYNLGDAPTDLNRGPQTVLQDGFAVFPFTVNTPSVYGIATVTCTLGGLSATTTVKFDINHVIPTPTPTATPTNTPTPLVTFR